MKGRPRRFARSQIVAGWVCLLVSIALFVVAGIGWQPFGTRPDFGPLPLALLLIAGWVLFQLNLVRLLKGLLNVAGDAGDALDQEDDHAPE